MVPQLTDLSFLASTQPTFPPPPRQKQPLHLYNLPGKTTHSQKPNPAAPTIRSQRKTTSRLFNPVSKCHNRSNLQIKFPTPLFPARQRLFLPYLQPNHAPSSVPFSTPTTGSPGNIIGTPNPTSPRYCPHPLISSLLP